MGYKFTLTLNRQITDDECAALMKAGCEGASVTTVPYPTGADPDLIVTQLDFDDNESANLEVAITVALDAVKVVPDLSVATFSAPAQPNGMPPDEDDEWADLDALPAPDAALPPPDAAPADAALPAADAAPPAADAAADDAAPATADGELESVAQ